MMVALLERAGGCKICQVLGPTYLEARLQGIGVTDSNAALRSHLARSPHCREELDLMVNLIRWREAEQPFNRGVLPAFGLPALIASIIQERGRR